MKRATRPVHILVIEDELGLCRLLRRALEASRHVVDVAPIHYLRDKIDVGASPRLLHTVRGVGYVLRAE